MKCSTYIDFLLLNPFTAKFDPFIFANCAIISRLWSVKTVGLHITSCCNVFWYYCCQYGYIIGCLYFSGRTSWSKYALAGLQTSLQTSFFWNTLLSWSSRSIIVTIQSISTSTCCALRVSTDFDESLFRRFSTMRIFSAFSNFLYLYFTTWQTLFATR
jgi:hypothetical protein